MPRYLRRRIPGATVFSTVALQDRGSRLLVEEVDRLREAVRLTREAPLRTSGVAGAAGPYPRGVGTAGVGEIAFACSEFSKYLEQWLADAELLSDDELKPSTIRFLVRFESATTPETN